MALITSHIHAEERAHYLTREHDKRVEEYIALEKLLPNSQERAAIRVAAGILNAQREGYLADFLSAYERRLENAGY